MTEPKVFNVVFRNQDKQLDNRIVREEHLNNFLYHKGFAIVDYYEMGKLYEVESGSVNVEVK